MTFLEIEENRETKNEHYLAQIAAEIRRGNVKHPNKIKHTDFLFKMKKVQKSNPMLSKAIWASALGIKIKK